MCHLIHRRTLLGLWQFFGNGGWLETGTVLSTIVPKICLKMLKSVRSTVGLAVLLEKFGGRMGSLTYRKAYIRSSLGCRDSCLVKNPMPPGFSIAKTLGLEILMEPVTLSIASCTSRALVQKYNMQLSLPWKRKISFGQLEKNLQRAVFYYVGKHFCI